MTAAAATTTTTTINTKCKYNNNGVLSWMCYVIIIVCVSNLIM
jgi:hypothetical protein